MFGPDTLGKAQIDVFCVGHHHADHGIQEIEGKWYVTPGSVTRTGVHKDDTLRKPAAALITLTEAKVEVKKVRPKYPEPQDHLNLEVHEQVVAEKKALEAFMQVLAGADFSLTDPRQVLKSMGLVKDVHVRVEQFLAEAEAELARD